MLVDSEAELLAAMNASNGSLVACVATDDADFGARVAEQLQSFKVGINKPRSRGDREEVFGGKGASWKGAFVGGDLLVQAVTEGDGHGLRQLPDLLAVPEQGLSGGQRGRRSTAPAARPATTTARP